MLFLQKRKKIARAGEVFLQRATDTLVVFFLITVTLAIPLSPAFAQSAPTAISAGADAVTSAPVAAQTSAGSVNAAVDASTAAIPASNPAAGSAPGTGSAASPALPDPAAASPASSDPAAPPTAISTDPSAAAVDTTAQTDTTSGAAPIAKSSLLRPAFSALSALSADTASQSSGPNLGPSVYSSFDRDLVKIDKNTGALDTTYPISIPPGRNNLQPDLDLVYNSQDSRQGNIFGEGWSISIPYIERLNINGVDNLYSGAAPGRFTSTLDGELATTSAETAYIARTDNGAFNKYKFSNNQWVMTDKNGTRYTFGSTEESRQSDPGNSADVYKWMLKEVEDTNGNNITYSYFTDSGQIYPSTVVYTGNGSSVGMFEVDFVRTASADNAPSFSTGFAVRSNYRIGEIDVQVSGSWVRKYVLSYAAGDNANTSLLESILRSGRDSLGTVVSLPATAFSYQTHSAGWTSAPAWNPPAPFVANLGSDDGMRVADVNGDGLPDIISGSAAYLNTGAGWTSSPSWTSPAAFSTNGQDTGVRIVDVNGDGLPDIISGSAAYLNNGSGWTASSVWTSPVPFAASGVGLGAIIADVNGDGLPDIISSGAAYINNGNGWTNNPAWNPPLPFAADGGVDNGTRVADVNGDGLPDILSGYTDASGVAQYAAYINNGNGWTSDPTWDPPAPFMTNGGWDSGMRFADVNGDNLPDIIAGFSDVSGNPRFAAYTNNGHGWTQDTAWNPPAIFDTDGGYDAGMRIADVNGDGLPDIISGSTDFQNNSNFAAWTDTSANRADLLIGITYPQGGSSVVEYRSAVQSAGNSPGSANQAPYPIYVVTKITTNDGAGNQSLVAYRYSGGFYYYGSPYDRQFAGFNMVTETDAAGNVTTTYFHTGRGSDSARGEYQDNFWKIGKPYRVQSFDGAGNLYKTTINKWGFFGLGGNAAFVFLDQTVSSEYDGGTSHKDAAETHTYDDATGNETQIIQWGQVTGSDDGSFGDTGSDKYTTSDTYAADTTGGGVTGKVSDAVTSDQNGNKVKETQYLYDNLPLGSVGAGNMTEQDNWISGSAFASVKNTYDSYGLVTATADPLGNETSYTYDAFNLYPATATNALNQSTKYQYDDSSGKATETIDPNGNTFQTTYDGLGRTLQELQPDLSSSSTLVLKTAFTYGDAADAVNVAEQDYLNAATTIATYRYYDGLNRLMQTRKSASEDGVYKVSDRAYNNVGLLRNESLPYFETGSAKTAPTSTAELFTNYTYDPLGRTKTATNAVAAVSSAFAPWETTVADARGNPKDELNDAYGNLIEVDEHNGASTYATAYSYDGLGDLLKITDANGNVRNFTYDALGRRQTAEDLHASGNPAFGVWSYAYDVAGNVTSRTDPKNQTVAYAYDALNRELTETVTGSSGPAVTYAYDTCANGVGRMCSAANADATVTDIYDPVGNVSGETKTIDGTGYTTAYTYDRQRNKLTVTSPDGSEVAYAYNGAGLLASIQEQEPGSAGPGDVVSSFGYSPLDQVASQVDANGVTTENVYDPARLYRLNNKVTTESASRSRQDISNSTPPGLAAGARSSSSTAAQNASTVPPSANAATFSATVASPNAPAAGSFVTNPTVSKTFTGAVTSYTVPAGVTQLAITANGAEGGSSGGLGGKVAGVLAVTPGTTYYINVGGQNGYNGGSPGGPAWESGQSGARNSGGMGGGMTWISANSVFTTSTVLLVAGGGGGVGGQGSDAGTGGAGGGGAGGGATSAGSGGTGSSNYCIVHLCAGGGGGGGQTAGGAAGSPAGPQAYLGTAGFVGQGGFGGYANYLGGAGGGGGGGYYGGGGGAGNGYNTGGFMGGGGGGGSSYVSGFVEGATNVAGVNTGDGSVTIIPITPLASLNQYYTDWITPLVEGDSTDQGSVMFGATLNSNATSSLQLQVEVEPGGSAFTNVPNVPSSALVTPGTAVTVTFAGPTGSYHWQARITDAQNNASAWQMFSSSAAASDFILAPPPPVKRTFVTKSYTGGVATYTVPAGVSKITVTAFGAQGNGRADYWAYNGGLGGTAAGTFPVRSGMTYYYNIGSQGGYGGGGSGCYAGGGMTWFSGSSTFDPSVLLDAAGGGGAAWIGLAGTYGGYGGGTTGGQGGSSRSGYPGATGGSQSGGGNPGSSTNFSGTLGSGGGFGTGGNGYLYAYACGGGGGAGYYGGGGGSMNNNVDANGGGGGSSYVSNLLNNTSTASGVNAGDGHLSIIEEYSPITPLTSMNQFATDGVTVLGEGSSSGQGAVVFGATLNSNASTSLQLQVEAELVWTPFRNVPNVASSAFVPPGSGATATFTGPPGNYHWQARAVDAQGNTSFWQVFDPNVAATDFILATAVPISYTGAVTSFTVPAHVVGLSITAYGAAGSGSGGLGGMTMGRLSVTPGTTYYVNVGGQNGYGGGGVAGSQGTPNIGNTGGGMTWFSSQNIFSQNAPTLLVAAGGGGGGGSGFLTSPFSGGSGGGTAGGTGGSGGIWCGGNCFGPIGGGGATQSVGGSGGGGNGSLGQGGSGTNGAYCCTPFSMAGGGGGGGGGGYYGGAGGQGGVNNGGGAGGGGGGGGSSYTSLAFTGTNTSAGANSGNGWLTISEQFDPAPSISSLNQLSPDGTTSITEGSSTTQGAVTLSAALNSYVAYKLQLQVEVEPAGTAFTNVPNVTSSAFVAPGNTATTTFAGPNGSYHWQARAIDDVGGASPWQGFAVVNLGVPVGTTNKTYTGALDTYTVPAGVTKLLVTANGAQGGEGGADTGQYTANGGYGGAIYGELTVVPGTTYYLKVGGQGGTGAIHASGGAGGYNGGGGGAIDGNWYSSGGGGGMTWFSATSAFMPSNALLVAGGGGGGAWNSTPGHSTGGGGGTTGQTGGSGQYLPQGTGGAGGSQSAGGTGGTYGGTNGSAGQGGGGSGANGNYNTPGGGGGAGYYGGGGGGGSVISYNQGGIGGGGSSYADSNLANVSTTADVNAGNGSLAIVAIGGVQPPSSADFTIAAAKISFTFPANGGATPNFPNWSLNADGLASSTNYQLQVTWSAPGSPLQVATSTATGADLAAGVSVPKTLFPGDTTLNGTPVAITANASLADANGAVIATTTVNFTEGTTPLSLGCGSEKLQCISYQYDNNGNITSIIDDAPTDAGKSVDYAYDPLNRLISASSSNAVNGEDYRQTFSYDPVGNILTGPAGTYAYNAGASFGNANPDAVASIASGASSTTFFYDPDGNLTSDSNGLAYSWDYNNRLISASSSNATSTYGYDFTGERIKTSNATSTVYDPEVTYSTDGTTPTKHIFAAGALVETITGTSASSTAYTVLTDHLGGSSMILDSTGAVSELIDYFPYGSPRLDEKSGTYNEKRKYIGQQYDAETQLSYLNARYYNGGRGGFISEDPVFLAIGSQQLCQLIGGKLSGILSDPQLLNAYSYARDNPVSDKDPSGKLTASQTAAISATLAQISATLQNISRTLSSSSSGGSGGFSSGSSDIHASTRPVNTNSGSGGPGFSTGVYGSTPSITGTNGSGSSFGAFGVGGFTFPNLLRHFDSHGSDFGAQSPGEYSDMSQQFLKDSVNDNTGQLFKYNADQNTLRIYDPVSNTFGSYNTDAGASRTFFKPDPEIHGYSTNMEYFENQEGDSVTAVEAVQYLEEILGPLL
jgi:RHS repeat-associated protein